MLADRRRNLAVAAFALALALSGAVFGKDLRTAFIRLVPETDWKPEKGIAYAIEVVNESSHEKAAEFAAALPDELEEQLGRVLGYQIDPAADTTLQFTVAEFDPGNAGLRLGVGFGGKAYVGGTIAVLSGTERQSIGSLLFSLRPNLPGAAGMARESAAGIALKLSNGERDQELHPMKRKK